MASTFGKSFAREFGKNTGKLVSNALYGDHWSTPYRRVGSGSSAASARAERARIEAESRAETARIEANARAAIEHQNQLNLLDSAVIENVDKLNGIQIPRDKNGILQLLSMLSGQMKSIKLEKDSDEADIRNKYLFALVEKYRQCVFELQCLDPYDAHIAMYGQILEERVSEIEYEKTKKVLKTIYKWMAIVAGVLLFLFIPMDGGNKDGSWNIPQYIIVLDVVVAAMLFISIPVIAITAKVKSKKKKQERIAQYIVEKTAPAQSSAPTSYEPNDSNKNPETKLESSLHATVNEKSSPAFEVEDGLDNSIFFDLNINNRIGAALSHIWHKYQNSVDSEIISRRPIFAADGVQDSILFVGVNPSFDPEDDNRFLENDDQQSLLYGSFYGRKDSPVYFKRLEMFAAELGKTYTHINLLYARENDRNKLLETNPDFIREQLELTYETIVKINPKAVVFFTDFCKKLIFGPGRWTDQSSFNPRSGSFILNGTNIPIFFSEDVTTLDADSVDSLIYRMKELNL